MGWHSRDQGDSKVWLSGLVVQMMKISEFVAGSRGRVERDVIDIKLVG